MGATRSLLPVSPRGNVGDLAIMAANDSTAIRRSILFSGRVQGVGFRYLTRELAADFRVTGYVKNLPDGRVETVIEGESDEVDRFHRAVSRRMYSNIRGETHEEGSPTGESDRFDVRF